MCVVACRKTTGIYGVMSFLPDVTKGGMGNFWRDGVFLPDVTKGDLGNFSRDGFLWWMLLEGRGHSYLTIIH